MNDIEISVKLALVIGWLPSQIKVLGLTLSLPDERFVPEAKRRMFDYRDPSDIWPIAERYNVWPQLIIDGHNKGKWISWGSGHAVTCDTAAKAVALAVITNFCNESKGAKT